MPEATDTREKQIFGEALELKGPQREALLDAACGADAALRTRILRLLAAAETQDGFLRQSVANGDVPRPAGEGPGSRIGPYRLVEQIGEGGFGVVYLAEQEHPVRRRVAFKVIKLGMDTRSVIARFEQERQALALMDHPGIARVLDAGATTSGRPFFVMDLVKGEPITAYADRRGLTIPERLELFREVCGAVQHAHMKGIIHRDLKPSNILVSEQDGRSHARVIDFGIAKATSQRLTDSTVHTGFHQLIGTPAYMSPEQATGSLDIDTRADVYSLGVVLYELLTGATPHDEDTLRFASVAEMQRILREVDPPTPSSRISRAAASLHDLARKRGLHDARLGSALRGDLDWIAMRALEKDRARRYDSPGSLSADLARFLGGRPVEAAPPGALYRLRKTVARHRGAFIAAALVLATLLLGIAGTTAGLIEARSARFDAENEARESDRSARSAESVNTLMTTMVQRAGRAREQGRADITVREVMDAAAAELLAGKGGHEPEVEYALARAITNTYQQLSLYEPAETMARLAVDRAESVFGTRSLEAAESRQRLGNVLKSRAQEQAAGEQYALARDIFTAAGPEAGLHVARLKLETAALLAEDQRLDDAERELRESIAWFEGHSATDDDMYLKALNNLAVVLTLKNEHARAGPILTRLLDLQVERFGEDDPETIETLHGLAVVQATTGDPAAEATFRRVVALARRLHGDDHASVANLVNSLGTLLIRKDDLPGAEAAYRESVEISRRVLGPDHQETAERLYSLGAVLIDLGRFEEAEALLREASAAFHGPAAEAAPGVAGRPDALMTGYCLGLLLHRRSALEEAEPILRQALARAEAAHGDGARYEWIRWALGSVLGAVLTERGASETLAKEDRQAHLREAEGLITAAAERLPALGSKMGARQRRKMIPASFDRAVRLYTVWNQLDPSPLRAGALADWTRRRDDAASPAPAPPP
ncbi:MAG: serine/threonine-protein kinase [Phycisphaerales bacterium]